MFTKVLIANRGEIAVRIIGTARALGYRTVAVFSPVDEGLPHVTLADEAVALTANEASRSYLDIEQLVAAAIQSGADAIHPGYGFLAENDAFATACVDAGLVWIGPPASAIGQMGNKREAKALMEAAGVPVIPGTRGSDQNPAALVEAARELGVPVMIKAAAGGGGKGMRQVANEADLADGVRGAASEARSSFGSGELIVEKALTDARHVEVQVFADVHGNVIHLGERDCSMQRRHQKIVEECPSPAVDTALRERMGEAAVAAARAIGYVGAGTVEFLLDADGEFYFLEMNTRLQVEHPVTEMVTGLDLVAWQLQIAAGETLPLAQHQVEIAGHAMEARLYAECPEQDFMPQSGALGRWQAPAGRGRRVDAGVVEGQVISPSYDPLMAKIIAHGPDRETARRRLLRALEETVALGIKTNRGYLMRALSMTGFIEGAVTTSFVAENAGSLTGQRSDPARLAVAAGVLAGGGAAGRFARGEMPRSLDLRVDAGGGPEPAECRIQFEKQTLRVALAESEVCIESLQHLADRLEYRIDGRIRRAVCARIGDSLWLADEHGDLEVVDMSLAAPQALEQAGEGRLVVPMDGTVVDVPNAAGTSVGRGDAVLVMEAMKMETVLRADIDGVLGELSVRAGDSVSKGQVVAVITAQTDDG